MVFFKNSKQKTAQKATSQGSCSSFVGICHYLVWRPCSGLVLVVSQDEERQCAELWVLKGRVELVTRCLQVLI